jgi:hypothetical protein
MSVRLSGIILMGIAMSGIYIGRRSSAPRRGKSMKKIG